MVQTCDICARNKISDINMYKIISMLSTKTLITLALGSAFFLGFMALSMHYQLMFKELLALGFILGCIAFIKIVTIRK